MRRVIGTLALLAGLPGLAAAQRAGQPACDPQNAGLTVPQGFCVTIFADSVGPARHLVVAPNGDVFVAVANSGRGGGARGGILALRDSNGDGKADQREKFGENGGNGIALRGTNLYFAPDNSVLRYNLPAGQLVATGNPDTVVRDLPAVRSHVAKSIALGQGNDLYVNIGSPTNVCSTANVGQDPCPELETRAGIWLFDASRKGQTQGDGSRFATGLRNIVALTFWNGQLYGAQHGRDNLFQGFPQYFTQKDGAEKPAEIFVRIGKGDDYGWPYCFFDPDLKKQVLAPEYGGDGKQLGRCADVDQPLVAFPGHWAPNGVLFYEGRQFPARYRGGLFVAFHGSWNRAPEPQAGYNLTFVPFTNGQPSGPYEVFATGFAGKEVIVNPRDAVHRPVGLAQATDGSLYVTDDAGGRIYRIYYTGR